MAHCPGENLGFVVEQTITHVKSLRPTRWGQTVVETEEPFRDKMIRMCFGEVCPWY